MLLKKIDQFPNRHGLKTKIFERKIFEHIFEEIAASSLTRTFRFCSLKFKNPEDGHATLIIFNKTFVLGPTGPSNHQMLYYFDPHGKDADTYTYVQVASVPRPIQFVKRMWNVTEGTGGERR